MWRKKGYSYVEKSYGIFEAGNEERRNVNKKLS